MMKKRLLIIILIFLSAAGQLILAESFSDNLVGFRRLVLENNQDLKGYEKQITDLEAAVSQIFHLDESSISLSGGYSYNDAASSSLHNFTGSTGVTIPIIDQVSLSSQLNSAGNGSVTVQLHPLADIPENITQEQQLALLRLQYQSLWNQLNYQSTAAVLQYILAKQEMETAIAMLDVSRREYDFKQQQFAAGLLSVTELQQAANTFSQESIQSINALQNKAAKEQALLVLLSSRPVPAEALAMTISISGLQGLIAELEIRYNQLQADAQFSSLQEQSLLIQKTYLEKELKNTWLMDPQLSLTGSYAVSDLFGTPAFTPTAAVGISLQVAVSDFYFEDKNDLQDQIAELGQDMVLEQHSLQVVQAAQEGTLEIARLSEEMAERNLLSMQTAENIAAFDYEKDTINQFAYERIQLNNKSAEGNLFSSMINVYSQLSNLVQSYSYTGASQ